jgi:predicted DNA-binding ribbon-helix-helix protein
LSDKPKDAPAFDFFPERWLAGVATFSDAEQISFLRLLCHQWLKSDDGLPDDGTILKRLAGKGVTSSVLAKFPVSPDGARRNARLEDIRIQQRQRIAKRREGAMKTNEKRWAKPVAERPAERVDGDVDSDIKATSTASRHHPPPTPSTSIEVQSLTLPFDSEDFATAWEQWTRHRREKRKPLTPTSVTLQFKTLKDMGEVRSIAAINSSIANGYTGIFETKSHNAHLNGTPRNDSLNAKGRYS